MHINFSKSNCWLCKGLLLFLLVLPPFQVYCDEDVHTGIYQERSFAHKQTSVWKGQYLDHLSPLEFSLYEKGIGSTGVHNLRDINICLLASCTK
jgi:hypothetical protein